MYNQKVMANQSRPAVFAIAILALLTLLLCCVVVGGGFLVANQLQAQQRQIEALQATLAAPASAPAPATATLTPAALPSPLPAASPEAALPSAGPTAAPSAAPPVGGTTSVPAPSGRPAADLAQALVPEKRAALAANPRAPLYRIGARLDPQARTIAGSESIRVTGDGNAAIAEVCIRLYGNASFYSGGSAVQVSDVRLDGQNAAPRTEQANTLLRVPLAQPLAPGQSVEVGLRFTTTVPTTGGGYGIFNVSNGVFTLHYWHPELAAYNPDGSCVVHPVSANGDLHNTSSSNYLISFAAPQNYAIITSGVEVGQSPAAGGDTLHEIASPLTRNFVMVASDRFQQATQTSGAVKVNSYYLSADAQGGKSALSAAAKALDLFGKQFGPYPYTEFDLVEASLSGGAAGVESTGLILLSGDLYDPTKMNPFGSIGPLFGSSQAELDVLGFVAAHETAHEWWYGMVGNDAYQQPWLDESLANWSASYFVDQTAGADSGLMARDIFVRLPYLLILLDHDERLDQTVDRFSAEEYAGVVYGKGALMYDVLRKQLGDAKFFEFLRRYEQANEFKRADGAAWQQALAQVAGADTAGAFYAKWVEGASVQESDLPPGGPVADLFNNPLARELLRALLKEMQSTSQPK